MKFLEDVSVQGKKILVRISADVPMSEGSEKLVTDDIRLREMLPTLNFLLNRHAKIVLIGHLGRPKGKADPDLSLRPVFLHLSALLKRPVVFASQLFSAATQDAVNNLQEGELIGLENLRFDPGEENNSRTFAQRLATYGDMYVDEAFSNAHREHASMVAITEFLPSYAGLRFEKEYQLLTNLLRHPASPFVAVIGGAKVSDKLPAIKYLTQKADRVLIGGSIANTFLAATGAQIGNSAIEKDLMPLAKEIFSRAKGKIVLPIDSIFGSDKQIYDIGPKTIESFSRYLQGAKTVFWNGNLGKSEEAAYRNGSDSIARVIADSRATTIVGGGNTGEILDRLGLFREITFVSSGGGATLELLAGRELPAVKALN